MFDRVKAEVLELDDSDIDPRDLSGLIDALQAKLCRVLAAATKRGDHLPTGHTAVSWVAQTCSMSRTSAADRLCVGSQLESMPDLELAVQAGRISGDLGHLSLERAAGRERDHIDLELWIGYAQRFSLKDLRCLAGHARHAWDPEGFEKDGEEDYEQRYLYLSPLGRMYKLDALLDPEAGAALRTAIDALAKPLGATDTRAPKQRRADALKELVDHALDQGRLPRRSGVRPHVTVTTTVEGLKGELGAAASELQDGMPISSKTVQRLACDGTLCRVLKSDSMVVDVGRATRSILGSQRRAVNSRYRTCCGPGCDRPVSMTSVHHLEFWGNGGLNNLRNMVPLCYHHHRLVHEGGWQVIKVSDELRWIPPEREVIRRTRGPGGYRAA